MKVEYYKIFLTLCLFTLLVVPLFTLLVNRSARLWLKSGIEGENLRLDLNEVWEMIYMFMSLGSFMVLVYMVVNRSMFDTQYAWQEYSLMFLGTAGSNGVAAWIIYLKQRYAK